VDPAARFMALLPEPAPPLAEPSAGAPSHRRLAGRPLAIAGLALLVIVAAIGIPLVVHRLDRGLPAIDANAAGIIDPANGHITGQVELGDIPSGIASGAGSMWVALPAKGQVARIDPTTDAITDSIDVGDDPTGVAFGDGGLWVADTGSGSVDRIDPTTDEVVKEVTVGNAPGPIAFGGGSVWVANGLDGTVSKIDATRGVVTDPIPAGADPSGIAADAGTVWVALGASGQILPIDAARDEPASPWNVGNGPSGLAFDGRRLWVANSQSGTVMRLDPSTGDVDATVAVGGFPDALAAGAGALWVADPGGNAVSQIDPTGSGSLTRTIHVSNAPQALGFAGNELWVTARGSAASHQGGTLRVETSVAPDGIDPNAGADSLSQTLAAPVYDGLLTYARVGGAAGSTLVPDLATTIPQAQERGTTYRFTLRRGIRFSDGSSVLASDVRSSFERAFLIDGGPVYYLSSLVGAGKCSRHGCDLKAAIDVDDASGSVTFHLAAPDPRFLDVVALPFLAIVPSSSPLRDAGFSPLPGTGPYRIRSYTVSSDGHSGELVYERNPDFSQWSPEAQPTGYAVTIDVRFGVPIGRATTAVERGKADLLLDQPPPGRMPQIRTQYAARAHATTQLSLGYLFLNTTVAPFNDRNVREAANLAMDRAALSRAFPTVPELGRGGPTTCQLLPPNFPGYAAYCPYTQDPSADGAWHHADLEEAHRLVDASGTLHDHITLVAGPIFPEVASVAASALTALRYHVTVEHIRSVGRYVALVTDPASRVQIGPAVWFFGIPSSVDFLPPLAGCHGSWNLAQLCDPRIDAQIRRASALDATDPPAANQLWGTIDREVVDTGAYVPYTNPVNTYLTSASVGNYQ
jgi:YVTN family beta-propeller protein